MALREVLEGQQLQGENEKIAYRITTTPWGSSPSNVAVVVKDVLDSYRDVTSTVMPGSPTVSGDVITLPKLIGLTDGRIYRVEVKFDSAGTTFECYFDVGAEK
jgi:hypothetical protein